MGGIICHASILLCFEHSSISFVTAHSSSSSSTFGNRIDRSRVCEDKRWRRLYEALSESAGREETWNGAISPLVLELTDPDTFEWFKANYQECVEGLLSLVLYLSLHLTDRRATLLEFASRTARELNPLALLSGLATWPLFGQLDKLQFVWQGGELAAPLLTEPWRLRPRRCPSHLIPAQVHSLPKDHAELYLANASIPSTSRHLLHIWNCTGDVQEEFCKTIQQQTSLRLASSLRQSDVLVDAGVFDGTDWTLQGILAGATVLGFEPLAENRRLVDVRLPEALAAKGPECNNYSTFHTILDIKPGESIPQAEWKNVLARLAKAKTSSCTAARQTVTPDTESSKKYSDIRGHSYIFGAALGERARALNMMTRYDYSSVADQGYLSGPPDMQIEEVAMTTLDAIFGSYLPRVNDLGTIEVLKLDVEGYEMGALRGSERLLSEGLVHFLVLEFHPGMLGSSGTDPRGLLEFLRHYCFKCYSLKIESPLSFTDFVSRYTSSASLPMQGLGELEDLICENQAWPHSN